MSMDDFRKFRSYETMDPVEFNKIPKTEQQEWWTWIASGSPYPNGETTRKDLKTYADEWYNITHKDEDRYPEKVSKDNTAQEIGTVQAYQLRYISIALDPELRSNALTATLIDGLDSDAHDYWLDYSNEYFPNATENVKVVAPYNRIPISTEVENTGKLTKTEDGLRRTTTFKDRPLNYYFKIITNPSTGEKTPLWFRQ